MLVAYHALGGGTLVILLRVSYNVILMSISYTNPGEKGSSVKRFPQDSGTFWELSDLGLGILKSSSVRFWVP